MHFDFEKTVVLENKRVLLRPLEAGDREHLLPPSQSDPLLLQYSNTPVSTLALLDEYIAEALSEKAGRLRYPFIIYDREPGTYAGSTSFAAVSNRDQRLEIGWTWYGRSFQRTGLNRNVKFLMMQYAFEVLEFERVELKTDERNLQSRQAIEKIGGRLEGILRSHIRMRDGFRRNTVYYSILKNEWPALKATVFKKINS